MIWRELCNLVVESELWDYSQAWAGGYNVCTISLIVKSVIIKLFTTDVKTGQDLMQLSEKQITTTVNLIYFVNKCVKHLVLKNIIKAQDDCPHTNLHLFSGLVSVCVWYKNFVLIHHHASAACCQTLAS